MKRILAAGLFLTLAAPAWGQVRDKENERAFLDSFPDAHATATIGETAYQAYRRGDYGKALSKWRPAAERGNTNAQYNLGIMYHKGQGVKMDYAKAAKWYGDAAHRGYARAQYQFGFMYRHGKGVLQDYAKAAKWYRRAAERGHAEAQTYLGEMYADGLGVPQHFREAIKWYRKAALQGHARAQKLLGSMYTEGHGVPQDYVQAHKWLNLAVSQYRTSKSHFKRASVVDRRDAVAAKMTRAQIAEAQRLAREWRPKKNPGGRTTDTLGRLPQR